MTTAAIILCPDLPATGLRQSMHDPTIPLDVFDIFNALVISGNDNEVGNDITRSLIVDAIRRVHSSGVQRVFEHHQERCPQMPIIQQIDTKKTEFWQLGAIYENEGTIAGTYNVHQRIFLNQFGLSSPEDPTSQDHNDFNDRLWLVYGDQLTAHHIRSVKHEQFDASKPFDRRRWLLGILAWFHIQMNLLLTIVRTHWSPGRGDQRTHHCLESDIIAMGRTLTSRDNIKYHLTEPVVSQSFTARVLALFYAAMETKGYLADVQSNPYYFERPEHIDEAISRLTTGEFLELVEEIRLTAFTLDAWNGNGHTDPEFKTMCRMLQEIELFLTVRHAVKHGDIGMLRRLVDPLIVYFFGAFQSNYGNEMLFYRWNLSPVNTSELQHAILASGLVNWHGRRTTFKAVDLGLEHLNGSCKIEMKCYKNSTHDANIIFDRVCLTNTWIRGLRTKIEATFGEDMPGTHTTSSVGMDMFTLARNIFKGDLCTPRKVAEQTYSGYESEDILCNGMEVLAQKVESFNKQHIQHSATSDEGDLSQEDYTVLTDIQEYGSIITEAMDEAGDPAIVAPMIDGNIEGFMG